MPFSKRKPDTKMLFIMFQTKKFKLLRKTSLTNAPKFVEAHTKRTVSLFLIGNVVAHIKIQTL